MRPFHRDIRYAICSLRVPSRVIFPALVGTTTASRNALRLASADVYAPRRRGRHYDSPAIYSRYVHVRRYLRALLLTRAHTCCCVHVRTARVCRANCMAEKEREPVFRSRLCSTSRRKRRRKRRETVDCYNTIPLVERARFSLHRERSYEESHRTRNNVCRFKKIHAVCMGEGEGADSCARYLARKVKFARKNTSVNTDRQLQPRQINECVAHRVGKMSRVDKYLSPEK